MKKFAIPFICLVSLMFMTGFSSAPAPEKIKDFTLTDLSGNTVSLSSYMGKVVLLVFFATWCPACQDEVPQLEAIYNKYRSKNFEVVGINLREDKGSVQMFARENKLSFTILLDGKGKVGALYKVRYIPRIFILDRFGQIIFTSHYMPADDIEKEVKKALQ